jgi:hypothetical protein
MQPITQASLDPKLNNIRHLRAEQEFCGVIGCFGLVSPHPHLRTSLTYSQSYRLHRRGSVPDRGHAKPQCFDDSRDSKNDSIFGARREIQRRRRHAPSCMGATELQSNWAYMQKTLGKPGFCSGEDRNRTFRCFPNGFWKFERSLEQNSVQSARKFLTSGISTQSMVRTASRPSLTSGKMASLVLKSWNTN